MEDIQNRLHQLARNDLTEKVRGSQSIEEWADEITKTYRNCKIRPDKMVLILKRNGECYQGGLYLPPESFEVERD